MAFPGGFGTLDELFETLTLIQTRKVTPVPVLLFGQDFWNRIINFEELVAEGTIDQADLELFQYVETAASTRQSEAAHAKWCGISLPSLYGLQLTFLGIRFATLSSMGANRSAEHTKSVEDATAVPAGNEISAAVLRKLVGDASQYLGEKVTEAVITIPAYFDDAQTIQAELWSCREALADLEARLE